LIHRVACKKLQRVYGPQQPIAGFPVQVVDAIFEGGKTQSKETCLKRIE